MELEADIDAASLDFVKLVENPTWKDVLIGLVNKEQLDPWNIDIAEITHKYISVIRGMKQLDLHIPANMILAASVMLRMKSEALVFKPDTPEFLEVPPELSFDTGFTAMESVPGLVPNTLGRMRKVTLGELMDAVEEAFRFESRREARRASRQQLPAEALTSLLDDMEKVDVESLISEVYGRVLGSADQYGLVSFNAVCGGTPKDKVLSLLAVLYLNSSGYVELQQEEFFGEILVRVIDREKSLAKMVMTL
ncbi:MAG: segregation/condensation protein A [Candidatus Micrarchaeota archaeon]|nr:segregation/condensation protein A [Candidatus Micrarchaeota archaeon]